MKHRKKMKVFPAACLVCAAGIFGIGSTAAYLTSFDKAENSISVGSNTTGIEEEFPDPSPAPVEENPEYEKKVWISNTSPEQEGFLADCYVRMAVGCSHSDIFQAVVFKELDTENWIHGEDGYYYFRKSLKEGESTTPLFTGFYIDSSKVDPDSLSLIPEFEIQLYEESVQAEGFSDYKEAWDSWQDRV